MKFSSRPIEEHVEVPLADDGQWDNLVAHARSRFAPAKARDPAGNACYVVSVRHRNEGSDPHAKLAEIVALVRSQGDRVVGEEIILLSRRDPRTLLGRGASENIAAHAAECGADLLVFDAELSPSQMRNLEDLCGIAICDREAVILNVFLRHAKTRSARMQIEIAQLEYLRPRIRGLGLDMDQQAGGMMRARGPGETASELLARRLDGRLTDLRAALGHVSKSRSEQRSGRTRCHRIVLVGYTNAGKTTLMNALTAESLPARNMPFETLDTTSRCLSRHGTHVVISDTVGFIRRMPQRLLTSFESTLAEIRDASLVVVVVDASDTESAMHIATTERLLERLAARDTRRLYVFNKADRLPAQPSPARLRNLAHDNEHMVLSSHDANAVANLKRAILTRVRMNHRVARVFVAHDAPELVAKLHRRCRVLAAAPARNGMRYTVEGPVHVIAQIRSAGDRRRS